MIPCFPTNEWAQERGPKVHFGDLKRDMPTEIRRIASFLEIAIDESNWPAILEHCSFEWMKRNATKTVPLEGAFRDAGAEVFINKEVSGRWTETLTHEDCAAYETLAASNLGSDCSRWLAEGSRG